MPDYSMKYDGPQTPRRGLVWLMGQVVLDGSSVPVTTSAQDPRKHTRWVVTRTGTGVYLVTLDFKYQKLIKARGNVLAAVSATAGAILKPTAQDVSGAGTVTMTALRIDTGVAADPPASSTLLLELVLQEVAD